MENLQIKFYQKVDRVNTDFYRYLMHQIDWSNRMIGIKGARGTGKTTLLLQYAKLHLPNDHRTIYISLDDIYFSDKKLVDFVAEFVKQGGQNLLLDEVHRYSNWSIELKNIYDDYADLKIIFTGSSIIRLSEAKADLSRRAIMYEMNGLSYREFLNIQTKTTFSSYTIDEIKKNHNEIARTINKKIRPLEYWNEYLKIGYYPYFLENKSAYQQKLSTSIDLALSTDMPASFDISYASLEKIRQLLYIISESVPFKPNISKLSERVGTTRNSLKEFLHYLEELRIIKRVFASTKGISQLQKPDKILMHHPNLQFALTYKQTDKGSMRESFFVNQTAYQHKLSYAQAGDYIIEGAVFEIGGKGKSSKQIKNITNSFIAADDLEIGTKNKIPLWLFGFLY